MKIFIEPPRDGCRLSYSKLWKKMKVFALLMMLTITQVFAAGVYSQNTRISLNLTRTTVADVLNEIENKTEFNFFYNNKLIDVDREVDVKVENKDIYSILDKLFENTDVNYVVKNKHIILSNQLDNTQEQQASNKFKVTGRVTDAQDAPIVGVTVVVKGTTNGTVTNIDGEYSLKGISESSILQFSFVGMKTVEKNVGSNTVIDVKMLDDAIGLNEVVAVGYGTMKKSDLTGAVVRANVEDFRKSPNTNLGQVLQGTVPGLNVGQVTSAGGTPSIQIRGRNTINGKTDVLIILDGIIYNSSLSSINPNDIESIDVLKDASATAVYGAQAANGVILITTKKGTAGKTDISFSSSYTVQNPTKNLRPMNRSEYLSFVKEFYYDKAYSGPDYTTPVANLDLASLLPDEIMRDANQSDGIRANDYNWWDEGTRRGSILENKLSISGGNDAASYLLSFGNTKQENFILNDDFKRNSIRINLDAHPTDWWKLGVQSFGSFVNQDGAEPNVWGLRTQSPLILPYDEKGDIRPYPFNTLDTNPFMGSDVDDYERHNYFFANIYSEIMLPIKGLTYRLNLGNNYRIDQHYFASEYGAGLTGYAYKQHATYSDYTFDNIVNYVRNFGIHDLSATFVYGAVKRRFDYTDSNADGFSRITLGYNSLELGTNQFANSDAWDEALLYQMVRANYKLKNRYLITATLRRDGFSGFAENYKSALFPSVALGWVVSDEEFMEIEWFNYLKLRGGYGISSNQTSRYKSLAKVETQAGYVFGDGGSTLMSQKLASMQNSDLKWEKTTGINAGFDFGFLRNRLNGSFELYQTITNDLLYDVAIPTITAFRLSVQILVKFRIEVLSLLFHHAMSNERTLIGQLHSISLQIQIK